MLQFPSISVSVQQSSTEGPIGHKFFFSANCLSKYRILMLVKSQYLAIFPRMLLNNFLQENTQQVSHYLHLWMFLAFLALGQHLGWHVVHENE
jgi:hypothetical protein